jgi:hypothetical protein
MTIQEMADAAVARVTAECEAARRVPTPTKEQQLKRRSVGASEPCAMAHGTRKDGSLFIHRTVGKDALKTMMKFKFTGVAEMKRKMHTAAADIRRLQVRAVEAEAQKILKEAQSRVPVDTGQLRDSGRVEMHEDGTTIKARIVFGTDHAIPVHEDLEAKHPSGQAKFLESALNEASSTVAAGIASRMKLK